MIYVQRYESPLGIMIMEADDIGITGLWFEGQKHFAEEMIKDAEYRELDVFRQAKEWLDEYFKGNLIPMTLPLHFIGTEFQKEVWELLLQIPYGKSRTYGELTKELASKKGIDRMSAQAVGGAVGRNRISILVPCHRVLGTGGKLTGYAGGLERKAALLKLEGILADNYM